MLNAAEKYLNQEQQHIKIIHEGDKGYISLCYKDKDGNFNQKHYKYNDLMNLSLNENQNVYISQNTFYNTYRRIENIKELSNLYIDLDVKKDTNYTIEQVLYMLYNDYFNIKIPMPNLIINSGNGLHLIWHIKSVPYMALPLWNLIEKYLCKELKDFGADNKSTDCTRILRLAGTKNLKSNTICTILEIYNYIYDLREIQNNYLPELKPKNKKGRPKKIISLYNTYSLNYARLLDLIKIIELRNYNVIGHREFILFLYRYWSCCFKNDIIEALKDTLDVNNMFTIPLTKKEVITATRSAETAYKNKDKQYNYKNDTLIELLNITSEEEKYLKTIIGTKEKYRRKNIKRKQLKRNEEGLTKREQQKKELIKKVQALKTKGFNNTQIAKELNISRVYVSKIINNKI